MNDRNREIRRPAENVTLRLQGDAESAKIENTQSNVRKVPQSGQCSNLD